MSKPKILYAIQGTGNGHVARALEIVPILKKYAEVDILLSGNQSEIALPFDIMYQKRGLVMLYSKKGGVSIIKTLLHTNLFKLFKDVLDLPVKKYDLVINDFEFTSAWACKVKGGNCISMGHQASFASANVPLPKKQNPIGAFILKYYAPASAHIGYHFDAFDTFIKTPVIRQGIRQMQVQNLDHYTVYLPAYADRTLIKKLGKLKKEQWQVFSKRCKKAYQVNNVQIKPINNQAFLESFKNSAGVLTSAGFETPAEALFLGKKLFVIPIKHQYEQYCNAAALEKMGVSVVENLKKDNLKLLKYWCKKGKSLQIKYPDNTEQDIMQMLQTYLSSTLKSSNIIQAI